MMWIAKKLWLDTRERLAAALAENTLLRQRKNELEAATQAWGKENQLLYRRIDAWQDERAELVRKAASAQALADVLRVEINSGKEKEAALLAKLVPGIEMAVPRIESEDPAGVRMQFEDMGDAAARVHGLSDFIPDDARPEIHGAPRTPDS
jgi:hypothetical protein